MKRCFEDARTCIGIACAKIRTALSLEHRVEAIENSHKLKITR